LIIDLKVRIVARTKDRPVKPLLTLRQFGKTAEISATGAIGESPLFLLDYALRFLRVIATLALWRVILGGQGSVAGMSLGMLLTYTLISEVFGDPLTCRTDLSWHLYQGAIVPRFLQPMGLAVHYAAASVGTWTFNFIFFSVPLLVAAALFGVWVLPASALAALLFVVSLVLAVAIGLALEFIFGALAVYFEQNVYAIGRVRDGLSAVLSGILLPLAIYPRGLGEVFGYLPFASMASAPLQIYTGTGDPLRLLAIQLFWALLLWPTAQWLWRTNRQKLVTLGG